MVMPGQGDIFWVRFGASGDSGPSGMRPAVVIQNDLLNRSRIQTTVVALLSSNKKLAQVLWNVLLEKGTGNLKKSSVVSQIATVGKGRLVEKIGTLDKERIEEVIQGCKKVISLRIFSRFEIQKP